MKFLIVSGLSGSGKSIALQALEDMGYYCIDNLPGILIPHFAQQILAQSDFGLDSCAVSIDSRNRGFLESVPQNLQELATLGMDYKVIFLEAEESALIKRYSETRRRHPLTGPNTPLIEGIRREKQLLSPLYHAATRRIDTSNTTPQELRSLIRDFAGGELSSAPTLLFESFGYKHGTPLDADFVFDVRCLPNPFWNNELRSLSGLDSEVARFLENHDEVRRMIDDVRGFIEDWLPYFKTENRSYITIAIGCTGGQHRSVYVAEKLATYFGAQPLNVLTRHRELT